MNALKRVTIQVLTKVLPDDIKSAIFRMSFHLAKVEFERFAYQYAFAPNMALGLAAMAGRGFSPKTIIDVGAFEGKWSSMVKGVWPEANLLMIEPNIDKRRSLDQLAQRFDAKVFYELLGGREGKQVDFHVMDSGSSVMEERSNVPRTTERRTLRTLDSLNQYIEQPALLKVDAQGYELEILRGARAVLEKCAAILLEVAIIEINQGAPLVHDVLAELKSYGFVTYDILEIHRRPLDRALNQVDIIFVREGSELISDKRHYA